jgi:hypothetical protein
MTLSAPRFQASSGSRMSTPKIAIDQAKPRCRLAAVVSPSAVPRPNVSSTVPQ